MSQRRTGFGEGEFYHLYNRGNSKQTIYKDKADYERFQKLLYGMNSEKSIVFRLIGKEAHYSFDRGSHLVAIGAYCLMPNHFHILLTPLVEGGVQTFMRKVLTGYSMYFNKRYERTGILFEGRFKSQYASEDNYLKYLYSYIHLNPIKLIEPDWKKSGIRNLEDAKRYINAYEYSSYLDYVSGREQSTILHKEKFPEYFDEKKGIDSEMLEWLTFNPYLQ